MLAGAVAMSCVPKLSVAYTSAPIQHSHTARLSQALNEFGGIVSGWRLHGLISGSFQSATLVLLDRDHAVGALMTPGGRRAAADADGDDREGRNLRRPRCVAVADDHQQVDRGSLPLGERAQADAHVGATAAVQLDLRRGEHLSHIVHRGVAAGDDNLSAVAELTGEAA